MLEKMTYKEVDGLLYPQIEMPDETEDLTKLGKYGRKMCIRDRGIEPVFVAVGSSLVVLFFVIGFCSESIDVKDEMRFESILRIDVYKRQE